MEQKIQFDLGSINAREINITDIKIEVEFKCDSETAEKLCEVAKEYLSVLKPILQQIAMNA